MSSPSRSSQGSWYPLARWLGSPAALGAMGVALVMVVALAATKPDAAVIGPLARVVCVVSLGVSFLAALRVLQGPAQWGDDWERALSRAGWLVRLPWPYFTDECAEAVRPQVLRARQSRPWALALLMLALSLPAPALVGLVWGWPAQWGDVQLAPGQTIEAVDLTQPAEIPAGLGLRLSTRASSDPGVLTVSVRPAGGDSNDAVATEIAPLERFRVGPLVFAWAGTFPLLEMATLRVRARDTATGEVVHPDLTLVDGVPVDLAEGYAVVLVGSTVESAMGTGPVARVEHRAGDAPPRRTVLHLASPELDCTFPAGAWCFEPVDYTLARAADFRVVRTGWWTVDLPWVLLAFGLFLALALGAAVLAPATILVGRDGDFDLLVIDGWRSRQTRTLERVSRAWLGAPGADEWRALLRELALPDLWVAAPVSATSRSLQAGWAILAIVPLGVAALQGGGSIQDIALALAGLAVWGLVSGGRGAFLGWVAAAVVTLLTVVALGGSPVEGASMWPDVRLAFAALLFGVGAGALASLGVQETRGMWQSALWGAAAWIALALAAPLAVPGTAGDAILGLVAWTTEAGNLVSAGYLPTVSTAPWAALVAVLMVALALLAPTGAGRGYGAVALGALGLGVVLVVARAFGSPGEAMLSATASRAAAFADGTAAVERTFGEPLTSLPVLLWPWLLPVCVAFAILAFARAPQSDDAPDRPLAWTVVGVASVVAGGLHAWWAWTTLDTTVREQPQMVWWIAGATLVSGSLVGAYPQRWVRLASHALVVAVFLSMLQRLAGEMGW